MKDEAAHQRQLATLTPTRTEVARLADAGRIAETIKFGTGEREELIYTLEAVPSASVITAQYEHGRITVRIPVNVAKQWSETEQMSLEAWQQLTTDTELKLLIEKDFACLVGCVPEKDADAFPRPSFDM